MRTLWSIALLGLATLPGSSAQVDPDAYLTDSDIYMPFTAVAWQTQSVVPGIDPPLSAPASGAPVPSANPATTRETLPSAAPPSVIPPSVIPPSAAAPTTPPASVAVASAASPSAAAPNGEESNSPQGVVGVAAQSTSAPAEAGQEPSAATTITVPSPTAVVVVVTSDTPASSSIASGEVLNGAGATSGLGSGIAEPSVTGAADDKPAADTASASATTGSEGADPSETASGKAAKSNMNAGVIAGAVVGTVVGVALVLCALCLILRRRRRRPKAVGRAVHFTLDDDDWDPLMYSDKDKPESPASPILPSPYSATSAGTGYTMPWDVSVWEPSEAGSSSTGSPVSPLSPTGLPFSLRREKPGAASARRTRPRRRQSLFSRLFQSPRFRQEEDGGSIPYARIRSGPSDDVELIPPTYDPAWSESRLATPTTPLGTR